MTSHVFRTRERFFWGEDVSKVQPSCDCGWRGRWHGGWARDSHARSAWQAHLMAAVDEGTEPPLSPPERSGL